MSCLDKLKDFLFSDDISFARCPKDRNISEHCNITELAPKLNMSETRISEIIQQFLDLECLNYRLSLVKIPQHAVQGWLALILFTLMLATLWKLRTTLSPCTLIYHAATAVFEYPVAVNGIANGHLWYYAEDPYYNRIWAFAVWRHMLWSGWMIADMFKLALSCLTFFLCVERFVAICMPLQFRKINRPVVAISAAFFSLLVGTAHLWVAMGFDLFLQSDGQYVPKAQGSTYNKDPVYRSWASFLVRFTPVVRLISCGGIFILSVCTAIGLKKRANKIRAMSSAGQEEEAKMRKITRITLITAVCAMIDHIPWIAGRYWGFTLSSRRLPSDLYTLLTKHTSADIERRDYDGRVTLAIYHLAVWSNWFTHGIRFLVYLAFNKTMRDAFVSIFRKEQQQQQQPPPPKPQPQLQLPPPFAPQQQQQESEHRNDIRGEVQG